MSDLASTPIVESAPSADGSTPASAGLPAHVLVSAAASACAAAVLCAVTANAYPYFTVPEEYGFGMSPPPEVVAAWMKQQHRVDTLNSMVTFAVGGGLLGLTVGACCPGNRLSVANLAIGLAGGTTWGAVVGFLAVLIFRALLPRNAIASVMDSAFAQGAVFALLGLGLGVIHGLCIRNAEKAAVAGIAGAIGGAAGGLIYPILSGLIAASQSTQEMIPSGSVVRFVWLLLPFTAIGLLVPLLPDRVKLAGAKTSKRLMP